MIAMHRRRMIIAAAIVGGAALVLLVTVGLFGLVRGPADAEEAKRIAREASVSAGTATLVLQPRPIIATTDSERFVEAVTRALFTWDTRHQGGVSEWAQTLVDAADPEEASAIAADVRTYLPSPEYWTQLADYGTRQWIDVQSIVVPSAWSTARAQAAPGQLPEGAAAFTVVGVRQRAGTFGERDMRTSRRVAFTIFVACPAGDSCVLLRLSRPDAPLE